MPVDSLARLLGRLLASGAVALSSVGKRARAELEPLFEVGALVQERAGAGQRIRVVHVDSVDAFVASRYPSGIDSTVPAAVPNRARAVRERRDSKRGRRMESTALLIRGFGRNARLRVGGADLDLDAWTRAAGAAGVVIGGADVPGLAGSVAIVENLEFFLNLTRTPVKCDAAVFGRPSELTLRWFASPAMRDATYLYCGDYDPTGLSDYINVRDACPGRVTLFCPANVSELLRRFGNRELLRLSRNKMPRLRRETDPAVRQVVDLMDRFGAGLEQEVLIALDESGAARREQDPR